MNEKQFLKAEKGENLWNHVVDGINNIDKEVVNYVLTCYKNKLHLSDEKTLSNNTDIDIQKFKDLVLKLTHGKKSEYKKN